ncbi:MFS transporter [Actinomadura sp. NPDC023710]|uniref:MFS transporter n=1 Tax=Actinomadura sp. NPDC023710 TaxID=3158219 RepID=UPI0033F1ECB0
MKTAPPRPTESGRGAGRSTRHGSMLTGLEDMTEASSRARRLFLGGQSVSLLGDGCAVLAVPLLVLQLTRDPLAAGLAAAPRGIGYLLVGLPAGPVVDRLNPWRVLVAMDVLRAGVFVILPALVWLGAAPLGVVLALAFVGGAATVFFDAALTVAVKDLFPAEGLLTANSVLESAGRTSQMVGPAIVALLATWIGVETALLINAATFAVSLATLVPLLIEVRAGRTRGDDARDARSAGLLAPGRADRARVTPRSARLILRGLGEDLWEGLRFIVGFRPLLALTIVQTLVNLCLAVDTLIVYFARMQLGLPTPLVAAVITAGGFGGIAGAVTAPFIAARLGALPSISLGILLAAGSLLVMGASTGWAPLLAANAAQVWAVSIASVINRSTRQRWIPRELLGRVTTAARALFVAATPVGATAAGAVTKASGHDPRPAFLGAGLLIGAIIGCGWFGALRRYDTPAAVPDP